jgi:hypothetical protein
MREMHEYDRFLVAELQEEATVAYTLSEALARPETLSDTVARGGWCCRFYSRLSPADVHYLETTLDLSVANAFDDQSLLAVALEFRPQITFFLFALEADGLYEIVLMPWEGATVSAEAIAVAAEDVLLDVVRAIGWNPRLEFRRYADEL